MNLKPLPGYALIRLEKKYASGLSSEKQRFERRSCGVMLDFKTGKDTELKAMYSYDMAVGKTVYFEPFNEGEPIKIGDEEYVFLPLKELRGFDAKA